MKIEAKEKEVKEKEVKQTFVLPSSESGCGLDVHVPFLCALPHSQIRSLLRLRLFPLRLVFPGMSLGFGPPSGFVPLLPPFSVPSSVLLRLPSSRS